MNIIEFYKKETFVPKVILATLTALIIISFIEFLYEINTYGCYRDLLYSGSEKYIAFNGEKFPSPKICVSETKPLFLKAGLLSVFFPILLMSLWILLRKIFKKNENKLKNFFEFFEINRLDRGLFRIGLVLSWPWVVFVCIFVMFEIPDRASSWGRPADHLERFLEGVGMLIPIILFPLIWLLLKKVGIWIYKGFK